MSFVNKLFETDIRYTIDETFSMIFITFWFTFTDALSYILLNLPFALFFKFLVNRSSQK